MIYPIRYTYQQQGQFGKSQFIPPIVDYILIDNSNFFNVLSEAHSKGLALPNKWRDTLSDYNLIKAQDNILLYGQASSSLPLVNIIDEQSVGENWLVDSQLTKSKDQKILQLTLQVGLDPQEKYLIRFYRKNQTYFDLPLVYGQYPVKEWPGDKLLEVYYYLSPRVVGYQIFSWQGVNKVSSSQTMMVDFELMSQTEIIGL